LPRILGSEALILGIPLALLAALHTPDEYEATLGINALDCQGPFETYLFAAPALLIFGVGLVMMVCAGVIA
jgi:ABC-type proline/glycine betaine transport system permease subunit